MTGVGHKATKLLTLLSCLVISVLGQQDGPCEGQSTCTESKQCSWFVEFTKLKRTDNAEYKRRLPAIKDAICNKKEKKICCSIEYTPSWLPSMSSRECGDPHGTAFLVGGENTAIGEFPWSVLLGRKEHNTTGPVRWYCGGSLINRWYVLTAAHCGRPDVLRVGEWRVVDDTKPDINNEVVFTEKQLSSCRRRNRRCRNFKLVDSSLDCTDQFGDFVFSSQHDGDNCGPPHQDFSVAHYKKHAEYKALRSGVLINDIALVKLDKPVRLVTEGSSNISPICLPLPGTIQGSPEDIGEPGSGFSNGQGVVVGWGKTYNPTDRLSGNNGLTIVESANQKKLKIPFVPSAQCREQVHRDIRASYHVCGGGVPGKDSCNGDSGGPLIYRRNNNQPFWLVGAVSFGTRVCATGTPAVFTRITSYIEWISQNLT